MDGFRFSPRLDQGRGATDHRAVDDETDRIDPREVARTKRRDRDAAAEERALMKPGMGKVFKQILDRQRRDVEEPPPKRRRR